MAPELGGELRPPPSASPREAVARAKPALGVERSGVGGSSSAGGRNVGGAPKPRAARLTVQVQPRASRNEVAVAADGTLRVRVTAPPADGAANAAVRALVADALDCPRSAVTIVRGASARAKVVGIAGIGPDELGRRLAALR